MSTAAAPLNTKRVEGRRAVRYQSLDELLADSERLAQCQVRTLGNWSQGQIYEHLARGLDVSIDGTKPLPAPLRLVLRMLFKKKFLQSAVPAGFKAPSEFNPDPISAADGLASLRRAVARQREVTERAPHPGFGNITREEWDLFHLRHAEMHMSFILEE